MLANRRNTRSNIKNIMTKVYIIGVGLIGGSLGLDIKSLYPNVEIIGVDSTKLTEMVHIKRITPTKGKELTIIQQIIGNVGRFGSPVDKDHQF